MDGWSQGMVGIGGSRTNGLQTTPTRMEQGLKLRIWFTMDMDCTLT
jgi:hypothetical protein